ncbi:hypothetical protein RB594_003193 [Gaeumannomyces avenae]
MKGILSAVGLILAFFGVVAVAIYETVIANQLSLPTSPLAIPTLILPFLALLNALYAHRVSAARQRRLTTTTTNTTNTANTNNKQPTNPSPDRHRPFLTAAALQALQALASTVLGTLLAAGAGAPAAVAPCLLETAWRRMYSAHDEATIRRIQDRLACCGFNSPRDRAWPFARGGENGVPADRCEAMWGRHTACRGPWTAATRWNAGVELGVVLVVTSFQIFSVLMLARSSSPRRNGNSGSRGASWFDSMFGGQQGSSSSSLPPDQQRRLLANGDEGAYTDRVREEEEDGADDEEAGTRGAGAPLLGGGAAPNNNAATRGGGHANGPRLEPSLLGAGVHERNEWRDDV